MYWNELKVWEKSHTLVLQIYKAIANFPESEKYALSTQLKRAAYSITANIVEGHSRKTPKEFVQFLYYARGSLEEVRYFLLLSKDLSYIPDNLFIELESKAVDISKMLNGLIKSIKQKILTPSP